MNKSIITTKFGDLELNLLSDGIVIVQKRLDSGTDALALAPEDMEALGKALFGIKKRCYPNAVPPQQKQTFLNSKPKEGALNYIEQQKQIHSQAYAKWTADDETLLKEMVAKGKSDLEIADALGRGIGSIINRKQKLGL